MITTVDYISLIIIILYNLLLIGYFIKNHQKALKTVNIPCKAGQDLWCLSEQNKIEKVKCLKVIPFDRNTLFVKYRENSSGNVYQSVLGKQVWLSEKEAINNIYLN